jgi:hypothetical protein
MARSMGGLGNLGVGRTTSGAGVLDRPTDEHRYQWSSQVVWTDLATVWWTKYVDATIPLSASKNPVWVARMMDHKDWPMITKVYGRWIPPIAPEAGMKMAAL